MSARRVTNAGQPPSGVPPQIDGRTALAAVALCALGLAALWLFDLWVVRTRILTPFGNLPPLTPLYAFWSPLLRPAAVLFPLGAVLTVAIAPTLADPHRVGRRAFLAALSGLALLLPWTLFLVREPLSSLGSSFLIYPTEEFLADADRIRALGPFLAHYIQAMQHHHLSLHGAHFPPGHATLLYLVRLALGPGAFPPAVVVLGLSAAAVVVAFLALRMRVPEADARAGALLLLACPSLLDFACTSMDAVFLLMATAAWWASLRAFAHGSTTLNALWAGAALLLATCFSFSTLPLGLAVLLGGLLNAPGGWARAGRQLAVVGASFAGGAGLLYATTGFALWDCLREARTGGVALMTALIGGPPASVWAPLSYGNATAFLIGSGLALVPAALLRLRAGGLREDAWSTATLGALTTMAIGGLYFMETERVWLFAMPWVAALAVSRGRPTQAGLKILMAAGLAQALAMEILLFTLW